MKYKPYMRVATGPWALDRGVGMVELELQDLLADKLREIFKDYSLLSKSGALQIVQVFTQFLPQPEGITIREKASRGAIVPQGYQIEDIESVFPCAVVKVNGVLDELKGSLRKATVGTQIIVGTYDNSKDCQGYRDVCNIMEKIRLELLSLPGYVLGERFRMQLPYTSDLLEDQEWPYFFGLIEMTWETASPLY